MGKKTVEVLKNMIDKSSSMKKVKKGAARREIKSSSEFQKAMKEKMEQLEREKVARNTRQSNEGANVAKPATPTEPLTSNKGTPATSAQMVKAKVKSDRVGKETYNTGVQKNSRPSNDFEQQVDSRKVVKSTKLPQGTAEDAGLLAYKNINDANYAAKTTAKNKKLVKDVVEPIKESRRREDALINANNYKKGDRMTALNTQKRTEDTRSSKTGGENVTREAQIAKNDIRKSKKPGMSEKDYAKIYGKKKASGQGKADHKSVTDNFISENLSKSKEVVDKNKVSPSEAKKLSEYQKVSGELSPVTLKQPGAKPKNTNRDDAKRIIETKTRTSVKDIVSKIDKENKQMTPKQKRDLVKKLKGGAV